MMILKYSQLEEAFATFVEKLSAFIGADASPQIPVQIVIDDKQISKKSDLASTNGRYFFRDPERYRRFYIPHAESPGVYLFFDKDGIALYVGKSAREGVRLEKLNYELPNKANALGPLPSVAAGDQRRWAQH